MLIMNTWEKKHEISINEAWRILNIKTVYLTLLLRKPKNVNQYWVNDDIVSGFPSKVMNSMKS